MNIPAIFSAAYSAFKTAAIGFLIIFALGVLTALISAITSLLLALIPLLEITTKAAIYGYPLFISGIITLKLSEKRQIKETPAIKLLPITKPKTPKEIEVIQNGTIVTPPPSDEAPLPQTFYLSAKTPRQTEPLSNRLALEILCWKAFGETAKLLDEIKASELKSTAAELRIPKYRNMNKSTLLFEIMRNHDEFPEFSE